MEPTTFIKTQDSLSELYTHHSPRRNLMLKKMKPHPKIVIVGLGQIGYHNAEYITQLGLNVEGYDIDPRAVQRALNSGVIKKETKKLQGYDYYIICVSTHNPQNMSVPYLDGLLGVAEKIEAEGKAGALVTIESTIPRGTSKKVLSILHHKLHVAHVPHRYFGDEKEEHGVRQLRVLGGCKSCCSNEALLFYKNTLDIPIYTLSAVELAELTKVVENTHRFLEIAFAEELKMFCDFENLNFEELRTAVNTKWNENILEARQGIGGHCLPKDTRMYYGLSKAVLPFSTVSAALQSNEIYKQQIGCKEESIIFLPNPTISLRTRET